MSTYVELEFCELPNTPLDFDEIKFKDGDEKQLKLYKDSKLPRRKKKLTYDEIMDDRTKNYARVVPDGCVFIDFDNEKEAEEMYDIILKSKLRCLILETQHGYHFMFRVPDFYRVELTGATNWFGYKFDCKASTGAKSVVQILRVCGMDREERCSWDISELVSPKTIDIDTLDILPYWLWGKLKDTELHKKGKTGDRTKEDATVYTLTDNPFTQLMTMREGGRHNHIVSKCSYFALSNGFEMSEFKDLITAIHDQYLVKIGTPMPDSDLFGDLPERWADYEATLSSSGWSYDEEKRKWIESKAKKKDKIDERRAAEYLFEQFDFYGKGRKTDGTFEGLLYREKDGPFEYKNDYTVFRENLRAFSDQNFKDPFFKETEVQLMQMCSANNKFIQRNDTYIIVKNKVLSCITPEAFDFSWLGTKPPTDVVLRWNWYPESWVEENAERLGGQITWFIEQLSRNARGIPQPIVQDWLWVIAGASMVPANGLQKIIVMAGGGQNGKSLYTSLIRLCLGEDMFNEAKIFETSPHDGFWGATFDRGILSVTDDLPRIYSRDTFSYLKGGLTGTDTIEINEKFKPKRELPVLPQIIACTNFEFELYDKSEGMKRRVKILPTEYHVDDKDKDGDLQHKLVLNVKTKEEVAEYRMSESAFGDRGKRCMNMYTRESGVLKSLESGSLAWFANKARYMYFKWLMKELVLDDTEDMKERFDDVFSGGFDAEIQDFLEWYIKERGVSIWTKELYNEYADWHNEMATGESLMKEKSFSMKLGRTVRLMQDKGYKVSMRKALNDKKISLNKLFINEDV